MPGEVLDGLCEWPLESAAYKGAAPETAKPSARKIAGLSFMEISFNNKWA